MLAKAQDRGGRKVDVLYGFMQSYENKLGGGEGIEGLYGSITQASMQKVVDCLKHNSGLDSRSVFVDIGAGLGRPLLHALVSVGVSSAWGVELDRVKCDKALAFCKNVVHQLVIQELLPSNVKIPSVICSPVEKVASLEPATHAYSFWEGVPPSGKEAFGALFASSRTLRAVAVVQRAVRAQEPAAMMRDYGFGPVLLISSFPVKMSGSGRSFTAYVFTKISPAAANFLANAAAGATVNRMMTPPQDMQWPPSKQPQRVGRPTVSPLQIKPFCNDGTSALQVPLDDMLSPSVARRPAEEADGLASPTKKPCAADATVVATDNRGAAKPSQLAGAAARAKAVHQVLITSLPEYSRRTKQATAAGKPAEGKGGRNKIEACLAAKASETRKKAPAVATRSSQRLAAKAQAANAACAPQPAVQVEGS